MPFSTQSTNPQPASPSNPQNKRYSASNALFNAARALGSVGAPSGNLLPLTSASSSQPDSPAYSAKLANGSIAMNSDYSFNRSTSTSANPPQTPQRAAPYPYQPDQPLFSQTGNTMDPHHYPTTPQFNTGDGLSIKVEQATPQYGNTPSAGPSLPGALQPGPHRPTMGGNTLGTPTGSGTIPSLPQLSTQMQQSVGNTRSAPLNHTHNYSRSSPAGMDQSKYKPFSNTPDGNKFSKFTSPNPSSYVAQMSQNASYSPLGLADIRPHTKQGLGDGPMSPNMASDLEMPQQPTNSNYLTNWPIYAIDWCKWPPKPNSSHAGKIAIGSYLEDNHNYIQVLDAQRAEPDPNDPNADRGFEFVKTAEATHSYPVTRILWEPLSTSKPETNLLATSGDHLRLWSLPPDAGNQRSNSISRSSQSRETPVQKLSPLALLSNSKSPEHTAPITSLDWNVVSPSLIITSSIDTTCTIWDIPSLTAKTQLIAHDKEVFDVRFCAQSVDVFVSCGADGSVRMFDLRSLEHSTIIYEPSEKNDKSSQLSSPATYSPTIPSLSSSSQPFPPPLLRIAASPHDAHLLATISSDSPAIRILDVRQPGQALLELRGHAAAVNCIEWSPSRRGLLASGADDALVLVWDLMAQAGAVVPPGAAAGKNAAGQAVGVGERGPCAAWESEYEVSNLSWAPGVDGLGICGGRGVWGVLM